MELLLTSMVAWMHTTVKVWETQIIWRIKKDPMKVVMKDVSDLVRLISVVRKENIKLNSRLERTEDILKCIDSALLGMSSVDLKLDLPMIHIKEFLSTVAEADRLIRRSSRKGAVIVAEKMKELEDSMLNFYLVDLRHLLVSKMMMLQIGEQPPKVNTSCIQSTAKNPSLGDDVSSDSGMKENFQGIVVGPQNPVVELKGLMEECESPLVISAPQGYGKTTLARKVCQEASIKEKYGDWIFFLHVSATPDVTAIICKLREDINHRRHDKIPSSPLKISELKNFIKNIGIRDMLVVLDDVWPEWEFLIDDFNFDIPGYKLLVTSRFRFPRFDGYEMTRLYHDDEQALYLHSAFLDGCHSDRSDPHVNKVDPLLCEAPVFMWKRTPKDLVKGKSIYVENLEGMTKTIALVDMFETDNNHAYMFPSNYFEKRIMGDSNTSYGPAQA